MILISFKQLAMYLFTLVHLKTFFVYKIKVLVFLLNNKDHV
jgi:hypothetical protein